MESIAYKEYIDDLEKIYKIASQFANGDIINVPRNANGQPHGYGTIQNANGDHIIGNWVNGNISEGTIKYKNGDKYEGNILNKIPHGKGIYTDKIGVIYNGLWKNGLKEGVGIKTIVNGINFEELWGSGDLINSEPELLIPYKKKDKYGFCNKDEKIIIPCNYDNVDKFKGGLAAVKLYGKWGYIDIEGKLIIDYKYERNNTFYNGYARIDYRECSGNTYMDKLGKEYDYNPNHFYNGLHLVMVERDGKTFYSSVECKEDDEKYGYINIDNKLVISGKYEDAEDFSEGLASVSIDGEFRGYIDVTGKQITPFKYWLIRPFCNGFARVSVKKNGTSKYGYIDKNGKEITGLIYDDCSDFSKDGFAYVSKNGEKFIIDKQGKHTSPWKFGIPINGNALNFAEGLAMVELSGKWGYVNKELKIVIPCNFGGAHDFENGVARVTSGSLYKGGENRYGLIDNKGNQILAFKYSYISEFFDGLACVQFNTKYGYINIEGKEIIKCKYDFAHNFGDGIACVELNETYGYIDSEGKEFWED